MAYFCSLKTLFLFIGLSNFIFEKINSQLAENTLSPTEIEILLRPLMALPGQRTLQAQALRQQLINLIEEGLDEVGPDDDEVITKRNLQSLARSGYLKSINEDTPENELQDEAKRGIASLARNGDLHHTKREEIEELLDDLYDKRNIGSLARNYNLPYGKRFLGSLARNGDLNRFDAGKRNLASIMRNNGKRNFASLVANNNLPMSYEGKRNIASLARNGGKFIDKRNVAALLRQDNYLNQKHQNDDGSLSDTSQTEKPDNVDENNNEKLKHDASKRNLASVKATYQKYKRSVPARSKRQADYYDIQNEEYPEPVYQKQNTMDYEDFVHALSELYPSTEKRFLGRLPQMGKPKTTPPPKLMKRKIGAYF